MSSQSLFPPDTLPLPADATMDQQLGPAAWVLRQFASEYDNRILGALRQIRSQSPFRHMVTPGGYHVGRADLLW